MLAIIPRRKRKVRFGKNGLPIVRVNNRDRTITQIVQKGTDNPKTKKNETDLWMPTGTVLSPHKSAGIGNVCTFANKCIKLCLNGTGKGASTDPTMKDNIHGIRIARTVLWYEARDYFIETKHKELDRWESKAAAQGKRVCHRGNMLSDIAWEKHGLPQAHPNIQFYDYTKDPRRVGQVCDNYWVTFSRDSEADDGLCIELLQQGCNVAIAFDDGWTTGGRNLHGKKRGLPELPKEYKGFPVYDGDVNDARWEDPKGVWIALRFKAHNIQKRLEALDTGFAVPIGCGG